MKVFALAAVCTLLTTMGFITGYQGGFLTGEESSNKEWQKTTVDRGLAIYCPSNGKWAWLDECKQ